MNKETITMIVALILMGAILGAGGMILYYKPMIAEFRADGIKNDLFLECIKSKIMGQGKGQELYLLDVLSCAEVIINE